jgi:hypothetical protein
MIQIPDWKALSLNVALGYILSWLFAGLTYWVLKGWVGKLRAAALAYALSWPVWVVGSAALQKVNPTL